MHTIGGETTFVFYKKQISPTLDLPVFIVAVTLKEKGQPFFDDPLNSLLSVQALQRSRRQIPQANPLNLHYRLSAHFQNQIYPTPGFHIKELFTTYTDSIMVVYWRGFGQGCGVTSKKL